MNYKTDNKIIKLQRAGKVPEVEPVQTQRDNTSVKIFPIDTGQRRIKFKNDKQSEEILHEILAEAASKSDGRASGKFNKDLPLQTEHPELAVLFAPEFTTYGALGGAARIAGGLAASNVVSNTLGKAGDWVDSKLASNFVGPTMRIAGGLGGYVLGSGAVNPLLRSAAGNGITMGIPKETFSDLRGQYFNKLYNKAPKPADNKYIDRTIDHLFMENPELRKIGSKQMYRQYYDTVFPASKVQTPYAHGTNSDLSEGLSKSTKQINTGAPETLGRNDMYFNLQPETSLQYVDGIGIPFGHWNKRVYWPLKEILGKPYTSDAWKTQPITSATLREKVPNRAGKFTRDTGGTNGKWLSEYKAEFGTENKSNADFLKQLGVREGETFDDFVNRNRKIFSDIYNSGKYNGLYHVKVDASKPLKINGGNTYYSERGVWDLMKKKGADVLLHNNADNEFGSDVLVVPDVNPERIQILGSKPDMEKFKDFVGGHFRYNEPDIKYSKGNPTGSKIFTERYDGAPLRWDNINRDINVGKTEAINYLNSKRKQLTDQHNIDIAKRLFGVDIAPEPNPGLRASTDMEFTSTPILKGTWYPKFGVRLTFDPNSGTKGSTAFNYKNPAKDEISLDLSSDLEDAAFHEWLHRGNIGDGRESITRAFYKWKAKKLLEPEFWNDEYFGNPSETATNLLEIGRRNGITNTEYPGFNKAVEQLKYIIDKDPNKGYLLNKTRWKSKPKRVWDALQGKYMGLIPTGLVTGLMLNENGNE